MIRQLERFVGRDRLIQVIDEAVDPELIEFVVKNKRPDLYKEVIGSEDRYSEGKGCVKRWGLDVWEAWKNLVL